MYRPRSFRVDDLGKLHGLVRSVGFGTLISGSGGAELEATHLPLLLDAERGELGTLIGHFARANPNWHALEGEPEVLVTFLGPHAYVSPSWYASPVAVPTWNYAAVHVRGVPRLVTDRGVLRSQLERLVTEHEAYVDEPWSIERAGSIVEQLMEAIVGFEITITRIEGKWKLNQNRSAEDQAGVAAALERSARTGAAEVARIMRENLAPAEGSAAAGAARPDDPRAGAARPDGSRAGAPAPGPPPNPPEAARGPA